MGASKFVSGARTLLRVQADQTMFLSMATAAQVVERLAPLTGLLPSTLDRQLRAQRAVGQTPTAGRGGGKNSVHFSAHHMTAVLLGLAGQQPSDAPEAARLLHALPYLRTEGPRRDWMQPASTLGEEFVQMLEATVKLLVQEETIGSIEYNVRRSRIQSWRVILCLNPPPYATITFGRPGSLCFVYGGDSPELEPALIRWTNLSGRIFLAAAEMLADTYIQKNTVAAVLPLDTNESAKARQGQKSAGHPCQEVPAPSSDQSRANGSGGLNALSESICENTDFQGCALAGLVTTE